MASETEGSGLRPDEDCSSELVLRDILDGLSCSAVACRHGLNRATVVRRARMLALRLADTVGVEGLRREEAGFVRRLRRHRSALLTALDRYEPAAIEARRESRALGREEIERGAVRLKGRSRRRWHDLALYWLLVSTGLRPLEIARLQVRDYLDVDGSVRRRSELRPGVSLSGLSRPLLFMSSELDDALSAYLRERIAKGQGVGDAMLYRGLLPETPLFLLNDGSPYVIRSAGASATSRQWLCRTLLEVFRRIFRRADVPDLSTQSARLTVMTTLHAQGVQPRDIGRVLGIQDLRKVRGRLRPQTKDPQPLWRHRA